MNYTSWNLFLYFSQFLFYFSQKSSFGIYGIYCFFSSFCENNICLYFNYIIQYTLGVKAKVTHRQRSELSPTLRLKLLYWLYYYNPFFVAFSFIGLVCSFISSNSLIATACGIGFIASLGLEVWRSYLNIKYYKGDSLEKIEDEED